MPVQMMLARIVLNEIANRNLIFLREVEGDRQFAIEIGMCEAKSIDQRVKKLHKTLSPPRPLTHDLLVNSILDLGGKLESIAITDLRHDTYYALLRVRRGDEVIEIDARPSDAVAVAVTCSPPLPIYVSERVLDAVTREE
ncbi:MAG: bifunctional nuclease family protein [Pirellulales bacterium]